MHLPVPRCSAVSSLFTRLLARSVVFVLQISAASANAQPARVAAKPAPPALPPIKGKVPKGLVHHDFQRFLEDNAAAHGKPLNESEYGQIAKYYAEYGTQRNVRWDFAFFQMMHETNSLIYAVKRGGRWVEGAVQPEQYNFAGLGATENPDPVTGGRDAGNYFNSVQDGVIGHLQHLRVYAGDEIGSNYLKADRTKQVYNSIKGTATTYGQLAGRWAESDLQYGDKLLKYAERFEITREGALTPEIRDFFKKFLAALDEKVSSSSMEFVPKAAKLTMKLRPYKGEARFEPKSVIVRFQYETSPNEFGDVRKHDAKTTYTFSPGKRLPDGNYEGPLEHQLENSSKMNGKWRALPQDDGSFAVFLKERPTQYYPAAHFRLKPTN